MTREELLNLRTALFDEYKTRIALGEFDANSGVILKCLNGLLEILTHLIEMQKKSKNADK